MRCEISNEFKIVSCFVSKNGSFNGNCERDDGVASKASSKNSNNKKILKLNYPLIGKVESRKANKSVCIKYENVCECIYRSKWNCSREKKNELRQWKLEFVIWNWLEWEELSTHIHTNTSAHIHTWSSRFLFFFSRWHRFLLFVFQFQRKHFINFYCFKLVDKLCEEDDATLYWPSGLTFQMVR